MTKPKKSNLERMEALLDKELTAIEKEADTGALEKNSASKLVDYAKMQIAIDKAKIDLQSNAEIEKEAAEQLKKIKEEAKAELKAEMLRDAAKRKVGTDGN